jgi:hypothetical protein
MALEAHEMKIAHVYRFQNDMVLVFDESGAQMPEYNGPYDQQKAKVLRDAPSTARFWRGVWRMSAEEVDRDNW